jgi:hypothetical protein
MYFLKSTAKIPAPSRYPKPLQGLQIPKGPAGLTASAPVLQPSHLTGFATIARLGETQQAASQAVSIHPVARSPTTPWNRAGLKSQ